MRSFFDKGQKLKMEDREGGEKIGRLLQLGTKVEYGEMWDNLHFYVRACAKINNPKILQEKEK